MSMSGQHLHLETEELSFSDGLSGIFMGRVKHERHPKEFPRLVILLERHFSKTSLTHQKLHTVNKKCILSPPILHYLAANRTAKSPEMLGAQVKRGQKAPAVHHTYDGPSDSDSCGCSASNAGSRTCGQSRTASQARAVQIDIAKAI